MSTGPKASDNLELLKELMLGDEQREIAALKSKLTTFEDGSVERLSRDLVAAVELRNRLGDQAFEELVTAIQAGTESAIQRSVREDKSKLSKALFPIMGPAIRSYVVELFRNMVEDLNETVRNTTSVERLNWRFQAKSAGVPFSEYVMMKTANFKVEEVFLMQRDSGMLLQHVAVNPDDEDDDADLVSGMFTAIRSFVRDSFGDANEDQPEELKRFTFGERQVLIEDGPSMVLAAVVRGSPAPVVRETLKETLEELQRQFHELADQFSGSTAETAPMRPQLESALIESRPKPESQGGGLWRAWLILSVLALGIAGWIGYSIWEGRRWMRFQDELAAEPGIEVIDVKKSGLFHRTIVGLRDPLARDPAEIAAENTITPERVTYQFTEVPLPVPEFAEKRQATAEAEWDEKRQAVIAEVGGNIETTRKEIETTREEIATSSKELESAMDELLGSARTDLSNRLTALEKKHRESIVGLLRSQYGHLENVEFELTDEGVNVTGSAPMPEFSQIVTQVGRIPSLGTIDTSGLANATEARVAELLAAIEATGVRYESGSLNETDRESITRLTQLAGDLIIESGKLEQIFRFDVIAHPLIGELREGNRPIEQKRAEQVRQRLIEAGIPEVFLTSKISEDMSRAGDGVRLVPKLVPAE